MRQLQGLRRRGCCALRRDRETGREKTQEMRRRNVVALATPNKKKKAAVAPNKEIKSGKATKIC